MANIKFGELALSRYWRILNLAILILSTIGAYTMIDIGEFLTRWSLSTSPNHQTKNLTKVSRYTVHVFEIYDCGTRMS